MTRLFFYAMKGVKNMNKTRLAEYRATVKELAEQRADLQTELQAVLDKAKEEKRAMTEQEQNRFTELETQIKGIDTTMEAEERAKKLETPPEANNSSKIEEHTQVEERAFANYIRGVIEQRADTNLTTGDNGAVIPKSIAQKIIKRVYDTCPIYQMASRYNVKGTLTIPYYDESTQSITMAYASEFTDLESTSGKFTSIEMTGYLAGALTKVSKSLVNNSDFDLVNFVINAMGEAIAKWIEGELLNGTASKIAGMSGISQTVTAASASAITADELIDLQETIPDIYQSGAIWLMNKKTRTAIRKLKDSDGNYILNKDATARWGYTLFGKEVYTSDNVAEITPGSAVIYYGDMSGLAVKLAEEVNIEVLREKYATQHAIGVVGWVELDAKVENQQKLAKMVMKSV